MDATIALPTIILVSITLATLTQLEDLAQQSADKSIKFAEDSTKALDCAYTARPLSDCSPDLFSADFKAEVTETQRILADLKAQQPGANLQH